MKPRCYKPHFLRDESGVYLPIFVFAIVAAIAVLGLVIDSGRHSTANSQLQAIADTAVLAGLAYRAEIGPTYTEDTDKKAAIEERARAVALKNLQERGFEYVVGSSRLSALNVTFTPVDLSSTSRREYITVEISYRLPYILISSTPLEILGVNRTATEGIASGRASGDVATSNVVIVLDTSYSQACPATGNCDCAYTNTCATNVSSAKIQYLTKAVSSFLNNFVEGRDNISLIAFDTVGKVLVEFRGGGFQKSDFLLKLFGNDTHVPELSSAGTNPLSTEISPSGLSNISDGLLLAYSEAKRFGLLGSQKLSVVVYSDGAPTAMTGCFSGANSFTLSEDSTDRCPTGGREAVLAELQWAYGSGITADRSNGPSALLSRKYIAENVAKADRAPQNFIPTMTSAPNSIASCTNVAGTEPKDYLLWSVPRPAVGQENGDMTTAINNTLLPCLNNLGSYLPKDADLAPLVIEHAENRAGASIPFSDYKKVFFYRALSLAQRALIDKGKTNVFFVGAGNRSSLDPRAQVGSEFQGLRDDSSIRNGFGITLANDLILAGNKMVYRDDTDTCRDGCPSYFDYQGFYEWSSRFEEKKQGKSKDGFFIMADDPTQLSKIFKQVASRIVGAIS